MLAAEGQNEIKHRGQPVQSIAHGGRQTSRRHVAEVLRFLLVGGAAALLDLSAYLLLTFTGFPVTLAKGASFVIASAAAYIGNKHFTYRRRVKSRASVLLYGSLYAGTLVVNVLVNDGLLVLLRLREALEIGIAWVVATAISAVLNFVGTKFVIFRGERIT